MKRHKSDLPPEGLWVSPEGDYIPVVEHLLALQQQPEAFGLPDSARGADIPQLRELAEGMIRSGWIRFRYLAGTYAFEVDRARRRLSAIVDILVEANAFDRETLAISQAKPIDEFRGTVGDVHKGRILGQKTDPRRNTWRFTTKGTKA